MLRSSPAAGSAGEGLQGPLSLVDDALRVEVGGSDTRVRKSGDRSELLVAVPPSATDPRSAKLEVILSW